MEWPPLMIVTKKLSSAQAFGICSGFLAPLGMTPNWIFPQTVSRLSFDPLNINFWTGKQKRQAGVIWLAASMFQKRHAPIGAAKLRLSCFYTNPR
jgi:hypothetical protein